MKRNPLLAAILAPVCMLAACAGQPTASGATDDKSARQDSRCLRETGSKASRDDCLASGRVVSRDELERSGGASLGEALNRVSPL